MQRRRDLSNLSKQSIDGYNTNNAMHFYICRGGILLPALFEEGGYGMAPVVELYGLLGGFYVCSGGDGFEDQAVCRCTNEYLAY